jgi:tetraacyldisaccharide 4'-kinase
LLPLQAWWAGDTGAALTPAQLPRGPLIAAAGIGHPERFFDMLEHLGLQFQRLPLADHAALDPRPWPPDAPCVIVTEKDAVKLLPSAPDASRILVATLDLDLPTAVMDALRRWLAASPQA